MIAASLHDTIRKPASLIAAGVLLITVGCDGSGSDNVIEISPSDVPDANHRSLEIQFPVERLARRGDTWISDQLVDARVQRIPPEDRTEFLADPGRIADVIGELLLINAVVDDARRSGVLTDPDRAARLYLQAASAIVQEMQEAVRARAELESYTPQAREMYLRDPERYAVEPTVSFTQILVSDGNAPKGRAEELLAAARDGSSLEELALEHSDDPTAADNGGTLESVPHERLDRQFLAGIKNLAVGELGLVESSYGWHVVRVDDRNPRRTRSFEEVQKELERTVRRQHLQNAWEDYLEQIAVGTFEIEAGGVEGILDRHAPGLANPEEVAEDAERAGPEAASVPGLKDRAEVDPGTTPEPDEDSQEPPH